MLTCGMFIHRCGFSVTEIGYQWVHRHSLLHTQQLCSHFCCWLVPLQVAINWCIAKGTLPIPGAKDLAQAKENLGALGWRLNSGEVAELDAAVGRCTKQALQNIFQTA